MCQVSQNSTPVSQSIKQYPFVLLLANICCDIQGTWTDALNVKPNISLYGTCAQLIWAFIYGQSVRFPASFLCLSFPDSFLYIASLRSGIRSGLGLCIRLYRYASQLVRRQLNWSKLNKMRDKNNDARLRLHRTGSVWDRYQTGTHKSCIYTGPGRSALDRFSYPVPNGFTCESDLVWNCNVPGWHHARVNPTQFRRTLP